ncbi:hypothetical protein BGZ76_004715 [Entomortierella beljakovae]|nr:hypothetical protein BGZ76_004715 [Entomortierella beljakovae]
MSNDSPEIAVAIQDFLICIEMVGAAMGHWYAFSHKDYFEKEITSGRMPIYYAFRDACGIKDIIQDSLDTLQGTRFNYRTFEPCEGIATLGKSRSGRIHAGLRYSQGGSSKYWLTESTNSAPGLMVEPNQFDPNIFKPLQIQQQSQEEEGGEGQGGGGQGGGGDVDRAPSLLFRDLYDSEDDDRESIEELYGASKQHEFGDYNFPVIDIHDPKEIEHEKKRRAWRSIRVGHKKRVYKGESEGDVKSSDQSIGMSESSRNGCIDNVNGYYSEPKLSNQQKRISMVEIHAVSRSDLNYTNENNNSSSSRQDMQPYIVNMSDKY